MTFSTQSRHSVSYAAEATYGTTPPSPDMLALRHTGCDLSLSKSSIESDEIRDDRQISHYLPGQHSVKGDIEFELNYGGVDDLLAAALYSSWSGNTLKTGTDQTSFSIERAFNDISQYQLFSGCTVDELDLSIQPGSLITGRAAMLGKSMAQSASSADASVSASPAHNPMDSFSATLKEGGSRIAVIAGIDLKLENGAEQVFVLGDEMASSALAGRSRISGEITAYFEDASLINKFLNKTPSSLEVTLSGAGGSYQILLPNILYTGAEAPVRGDKAVTLALPFVSLFDEAEATNIKITRTPA